MIQRFCAQTIVFGIILVNKYATFAELASSMAQFVLAQCRLVAWVDKRSGVGTPAKLVFSVGEVAFCAIITFSRRHEVMA